MIEIEVAERSLCGKCVGAQQSILVKCRIGCYELNILSIQRKGANDLFIDFLDRFRLPEDLAPLVASQLTKLYHHLNDDLIVQDTTLQTRLSGLEKELKNLKIRHGLGKIDGETYEVTFKHINEQLQETSKEMGHQIGTISNLDKLLNISLEKLAKLSRVWVSSDLENKRRIQKPFSQMVFTMTSKITII